ncbi:mandelate racemase, partial [Streptomyces sp. NPDC047072]
MKLLKPVVSVYTVPTDAPEADGTLSWDSTTMVIAEVTTGDATGTGWTYGPPTVGDFITGHLAPLVEGRVSGYAPSPSPCKEWIMLRRIRNASDCS